MIPTHIGVQSASRYSACPIDQADEPAPAFDAKETPHETWYHSIQLYLIFFTIHAVDECKCLYVGHELGLGRGPLSSPGSLFDRQCLSQVTPRPRRQLGWCPCLYTVAWCARRADALTAQSTHSGAVAATAGMHWRWWLSIAGHSHLSPQPPPTHLPRTHSCMEAHASGVFPALPHRPCAQLANAPAVCLAVRGDRR